MKDNLEGIGLGAMMPLFDRKTLRLYAAIHAMQGILASGMHGALKWEEIADKSIRAADALLKQLDGGTK